MKRAMLAVAVVLAGCGSSDLETGRRALLDGDHAKAVTTLRKALGENSEEAPDLYRKSLVGYREDLRRVNTTVETCDAAVSSLMALEGFGTGDSEEETLLLTQALVCAARHRARKGQAREAAELVIKGIKHLPGFTPDSPVLAKALREPAIEASRGGRVAETTALAQVFYGIGEEGFALSLLDVLEAAGPGPEDIYPVLRDRAQKAKNALGAVGLAAGYATWRGHPADASRWFGDLAAVKRAEGARATDLRQRFKRRSEEAYWIAESRGPTCEIVASDVAISSKVPNISSSALIAVKGGFVVSWTEGVTPPTKGAGARIITKSKSPEQSLKSVHVGFEGTKGKTVVIMDKLPAAEHAPEGDVQAAFAPKNRETSLALVRCGGVIELTARGAPQGTWVRALMGEDGRVAAPPTPIPPIGESSHLPGEDVWWNVCCANDQLVHIWLADTQLMRLAWFTEGQSEEEAANVRIPGFAPHFIVRGREDGATILTWVDIMGEGLSQIIQATIPEDHEVPMNEHGTNVEAQPVIEGIDGRVEHMRLTPIGGRYALTWYPQRSDLSLRWFDAAGAAQGEVAMVVRLREDARGVRFDAGTTEGRLGVAWSEALTEEWGNLYFLSVDQTGGSPTRPQRITGLIRPDVSPLVAGSGRVFAVAWVDRSTQGQEAMHLSLLRCGGTE